MIGYSMGTFLEILNQANKKLGIKYLSK